MVSIPWAQHKKKVKPLNKSKNREEDFNQRVIDQTLPNYFQCIRWNPTIFLPGLWRDQQLVDQKRKTRKYLFPIVKVLCLILIPIIRTIKRLCPFKIYSYLALNFLTTWFVRRCLSPEAQEVIYRHFALEANLINFIVRNSQAPEVELVELYPTKAEELGDWGGINATLLHDCNIMKLFIELGKSQSPNLLEKKSIQALDFSDLKLPVFKINDKKANRLMSLDLETGLYIMVLFLVILFDDDVAQSAANSLTLDDSLLNILCHWTGDEVFRHWSPYPYPSRVFWPFDPAKGLHQHILIYEYAYTKLCLFRDSETNPLTANV